MTGAVELKPCPFCGSGPAQGFGPHTNASFSGVEVHATGQVGMPEVYCSTCAAVGPPRETETEAVAAWNRSDDTATWNAAIQKAASIAHSGVEAYGAKMRAATDKKEKRDWQSMLMAAVDIEHAILALLKPEAKP